MHPLELAIGWAWLVFWIYWLVSAASSKASVLIVVAVLVAYFCYCGIIEERNLTATFPEAYPKYKSRTKMLIPFLL